MRKCRRKQKVFLDTPGYTLRFALVKRQTTPPARIQVGKESLERLKQRVTELLRRVGTLDEKLLRAVQSSRTPARRMGLSRAEALDLLLQLSRGAGINDSYARILRGAADVLGREGEGEATMDAIVTAAGVSRRTFYQFFRNKTEVQAALAEVLLAVLSHAACRALRDPGTTHTRMQRLVSTYLGAFAVAGHLLRLLIAESLRPGSPVTSPLEAHLTTVATEALPVWRTLTHGDDDLLALRARLASVLTLGLSLQLGPDSSEADMERARSIADSFLGLQTPEPVDADTAGD